MVTLLNRNRVAIIAWLVLVLLTAVSWALGTEHGFAGPDGRLPASLVILVVAVIKVRVVGVYFMELRDAPRRLRGAFDVYCLALLALLVIMYLLG
jgi:heme/copper-type cytochrome/quinol oxidase subunit 4